MIWLYIAVAFMLGALFDRLMYKVFFGGKRDPEKEIEIYKAGYSKGFNDGSKAE